MLPTILPGFPNMRSELAKCFKKKKKMYVGGRQVSASKEIKNQADIEYSSLTR